MVSPSSLFQSFDLDISVVSYSIVWCFIVALYVDCSSRLRCDASLFYVYFCGRLFVKFFTIHYWAQLGYFFFFGTNISYYFVTLSSLPPFWISFRIPCLIFFENLLNIIITRGTSLSLKNWRYSHLLQIANVIIRVIWNDSSFTQVTRGWSVTKSGQFQETSSWSFV